MVIRYQALDHPGGFYGYRVHELKIGKLCNGNRFSSLKGFLDKMFVDCPNAYFRGGPRSSALKFKMDHDIIEVRGHEVSTLAKYGLIENQERYNDNHSRVQMFMLEHDNSTVAMEIPIWLQSDELDMFQELFGSTEPLSGHIDVLRVDDSKVWIWDYKPKAHKEKYASTQVYFYSLMLSKRTGIPWGDFRCGYFDDRYAYLFKPRPETIINQKSLSGF
jgi:hypothetical protein